MAERGQDHLGSIRRNPIFATFDAVALARLAEGATARLLSSGESLFGGGEPAHRLFLIADGRFELLLEDEAGNRTRIDTIAAPRAAGMTCALDGSYAYSCEASSAKATAIAIPAVDFVAELAANPAAAKALLAYTSMQLRRLVGQLSDLKLKDSVQRLAGYLVELSPASQGAAEVVLPAEKRIVADRLGMKPETLSRALARLDAMGLVHAAGSVALRLTDLSSLRHLYLAGEEGALS